MIKHIIHQWEFTPLIVKINIFKKIIKTDLFDPGNHCAMLNLQNAVQILSFKSSITSVCWSLQSMKGTRTLVLRSVWGQMVAYTALSLPVVRYSLWRLKEPELCALTARWKHWLNTVSHLCSELVFKTAWGFTFAVFKIFILVYMII